MATDAGSISYTVDADTKGLLQAEKIVLNSIDKQVDKINALEKELISVSQKISKTGVVTNAYGQVNKVATKKLADLRSEMERTGNEARDAANKLKKLEEETDASARAFRIQADAAKRARDRTMKFTDATGKASNSTRSFGRNSGQAGIQFQQFIGQVQGGQSPMLAFSQQSADLGFVLGFPLLGAITGIAASITGIFLPSLLNGETAVGRLQKVMESLRETAITTDTGITLLSSGIEKLAKKSKAAAAIEIELAIKKANKAIIDARVSIRDAAEEWAGFGQGTSLLDRQFALAEKAAKRLGKTVEEITTGKAIEQGGLVAGLFGIEEARGIRDAVSSTAEEFRISKKSALEYLQALNGFKNRKVTFEEFSESILKISKANENSSDSFNDLASATGKATSSAAEAKDILTVLEAASSNLDKTLKTTSEGGFKAQERAAKDLSDALDQMFEAEERADEARARREETKIKGVQEGTLGLDPLQALEQRQKNEFDLLKLGFENKEGLEAEFLSRSTELNRQHQEELQALNKKTTEKSAVNWDALENQIVGTLASVVTGAQSGKEAMRALAQTVLTQMVGALIKMGIQSLIGQTTAAAAGVATAATLATAYAPAAALASLASFGANAAPAAAGIASTVALSSSLALAGSREHGGPVSAGRSFMVGERGPEIFTPNNSGRVASNKDSFGGGDTIININNMAPGVEVNAQASPDGKNVEITVRRAVKEVANQISRNQGEVARAMRQATNTTFKAR